MIKKNQNLHEIVDANGNNQMKIVNGLHFYGSIGS